MNYKHYLFLLFLLTTNLLVAQSYDVKPPLAPSVPIDPAMAKEGAICVFDGRYNLTETDSFVTWVDRVNGIIAQNDDFDTKPNVFGNGINCRAFNDPLDNSLSLSETILYQPNMSISILYTIDRVSADRVLLGRDTNQTGGWILFRHEQYLSFMGTNVGIGSIDYESEGPEIIQISCENGDCEAYANNEFIGIILGKPTNNAYRIQRINGLFNGQAVSPATYYYLSIHDSPYTPKEREGIFNYLINQFFGGAIKEN
jgi:hypothetical protein